MVNDQSNTGSFNIYLVIVVCLMVFTGALAMCDNWGSQIVEESGGDIRTILLPDSSLITLQPYSKVSFSKGASDKVNVMGLAAVEAKSGLRVFSPRVEIRCEGCKFEMEASDDATRILCLDGTLRVLHEVLDDGLKILEKLDEFVIDHLSNEFRVEKAVDKY